MSSTTSQEIKEILVEHTQKNQEYINERIFSIYIYGLVSGIIVSYTGFLGFITGVLSGIIFTNHFSGGRRSPLIASVSEKTSEVAVGVFFKMLQNLRRMAREMKDRSDRDDRNLGKKRE